MLEYPSPARTEAQGQASFEMANLRPATTGLPFVVWISQRAGARVLVEFWNGDIEYTEDAVERLVRV